MNTADLIAIGCAAVAAPSVCYFIYCTESLQRLRAQFIQPKPPMMQCDNCGCEFPSHPQATVEMHLKLRGDDAPPEVVAQIQRNTGMSDADAARLVAGEDVVLYKLACQRCQLRMFLLNLREGRPA